MGKLPHVPDWVRRERLRALHRKKYLVTKDQVIYPFFRRPAFSRFEQTAPRLVLPNKIADLHTFPVSPRFSTLPKDVLKRQLRAPERYFHFSE